MVAPVGYTDIALSFSPEAFYTGIPGADVSRGMLYGAGKAEKLHADTRLTMELSEREREFDMGLAEKVREYDESMEFGREQFDFFQEQYEDQYGLQRDYYDLARDYYNKQNQPGSGSSLDKVLDRLEKFGTNSGVNMKDLFNSSSGSGASRGFSIGYNPEPEPSSGSEYYDPFTNEESPLTWLMTQQGY